MNRIPALALVILGLLGGACAQKQVGADVTPAELSLKFKWIFQKGETTARRVSQPSIPNAPSLPTGYALFDGRSYVVRSTSIGSEALVSVNGLSATQADFGSIRILELEKNELVPGGYEWRDCTILPRSVADLRPPVEPHWVEYVEAYNRDMAKHFPDFNLKRVSCSPEGYGGRGADKYLLVVRQIQPQPRSPFTEIKLTLEAAETNGNADWRFVTSIANVGKKDAAEVNLSSHFEANINGVSVSSSQGKCRSSFGGIGRVVCHLGPLAAGRSATIEVIVSPKPETDPNYSDVRKGPWLIEGYAKERAVDPHWFANHFEFEPLKNQQ